MQTAHQGKLAALPSSRLLIAEKNCTKIPKFNATAWSGYGYLPMFFVCLCFVCANVWIVMETK